MTAHALTLADQVSAPVPAAATETSSSAVAAREKASVEARFIVALNRPRSVMQFRQRLLEACKRPGFADLAEYAKPVGGQKVRGPSIRFVEEALRHYGNVDVQTPVVFDDDERRIVRVTVTDLEANLTISVDVTVEKTVERRNKKNGDEVIRERTNSTGERVFILRATADDVLNKTNALISKALRNGGLRLLPGDIVEEAIAAAKDTRETEDARDPAAARKRVADLFFALGVMPQQIEEYLGHPLETMTAAEMALLKSMYTAIKEGEGSWADVSESQRGPNKSAPAPAKPGTDNLKAAIRQTAKAKPPEADEPATLEEHLATAVESLAIEDAREMKVGPQKQAVGTMSRRGIKSIRDWAWKKAAEVREELGDPSVLIQIVAACDLVDAEKAKEEAKAAAETTEAEPAATTEAADDLGF